MSDISEFYRDKAILITGATGFMGKVLVEKLMRSCSSFGRIYVLLRPKGSKTAEQRLSDMLQTVVFNSIRSSDPSLFDKVVPIPGDIMRPIIGLHKDTCAKLTEEVNIIFHAAATVKFDEELNVSINMNVRGTKELLKLAHQMKNLQAFVHVSTAYCNCDRAIIEERIYPMALEPNCVMNAVAGLTSSAVSRLTPLLLGSRPNTYTFTKALAESLIDAEGGDLPITLVRPSIVTCAWREPVPGWVDNLNGSTGLIAGVGKGYINSLVCRGELHADFVPVEIPINLMISAAWNVAVNRPQSIPVFNCTSSSLLSWDQMRSWCLPQLLSHPTLHPLLYPHCLFVTSRTVNWLRLTFTRLLPSYLLDLALFLCCKRSRMRQLFWKMTKATACLEYFCTHEWVFVNDNMKKLRHLMSETDRKRFNFDMKDIDWNEYFTSYWHGVKKYIFKEVPDDTVAHARLQRRFYIGLITPLLAMLTAVAFLLWRLPDVSTKLTKMCSMLSSANYILRLTTLRGK